MSTHSQSNRTFASNNHRGYSLSLRSRFMIAFGLLFFALLAAILVILLWGIPFTEYHGWYRQLQAETFRTLTTLGDIKEASILNRINELSNDIVVNSNNVFAKTKILEYRLVYLRLRQKGLEAQDLRLALQAEESYQTLLEYLDFYQAKYVEYLEIQIADAESGEVIISTNTDNIGVNISQTEYYQGTLLSGGLHLSQPSWDAVIQRPVMYFGNIIKDTNTQVTALIVVEIDLYHCLLPILQTVKGLGESGEALLVNQDATILTPLKYPLPDGSIAQPLVYINKGIPAILASQGKRGVIEAIDYRGVVVIADYRYIPITQDWGWGLVVKQDRSEVYSALQHNLSYTLGISLVGLLLVLGIAMAVSHNVTRPLRALVAAATQVAEGNLTARAPLHTRDETGLLAATFNQMVIRIQNWRRELEAEVAARTEELAFERNQMLSILDGFDDYIYVVDPQSYKVLFANQSFKKLFGKELVNGLCYQELQGFESPCDFCTNEIILRQYPQPYRWEHHNTVLQKTFDIQDRIIHWADGRKVRLEIAIDITARKQVEEALRQSEQKFHSLFTNMAEGVALHELVFDENGHPINYRIVDVNPQYEKILGLQRHEVLGKLATEVYRTPQPPYLEIYSQVAVSGRPDFMDVYFEPLDKYFDISVTPWGEKGFATIFSDVSDRKRAELALRESEERFRQLAENVRVAFWVATPGMRQILYTNAAFEQVWGVPPAELFKTYDNWLTYVAEEDRQRASDALEQEYRRERNEPLTIEYRIRRPDGSIRWVLDRSYPIRDENGQIYRYAGLIEDITEAKQYQMEKERLYHSLLEKNKELEQIVYVASHDLRSPLVNIHGFTQEIEKICHRVNHLLKSIPLPETVNEEVSVILNDEVPEALSYIYNSTNRMDALLSGLLRLSRLGRVELNITPLNMNELIHNVVGSFEFQIQQAGATLEVADLPNCRGDANQLTQVFANLIDNALKYRHPQRPLHIRISGQQENDFVVYCVEDNGIGIEAKHQEKIFELFYRLNPDASQGEGLGLTITRKIVDRHNGRIWIESQPGQGSKFFIALPTTLSKGAQW